MTLHEEAEMAGIPESIRISRDGKQIGYVRSMNVFISGKPTIQVQLTSWEAAEDIIEALKGSL